MKKLALLLVLLAMGIGLATGSAFAVCDQPFGIVQFVATVNNGDTIIFINTTNGANPRSMISRDPQVVAVANAAQAEWQLNLDAAMLFPTVSIRGDAAVCPAPAATFPSAGNVLVIQATCFP